MTDQSGGGSPVWLGVALIFVGMVSKDLFITDQQGELRKSKSHTMILIISPILLLKLFKQFFFTFVVSMLSEEYKGNFPCSENKY